MKDALDEEEKQMTGGDGGDGGDDDDGDWLGVTGDDDPISPFATSSALAVMVTRKSWCCGA